MNRSPKTALTVVAQAPAASTVSQRVQQLQAQARVLASEHIGALLQAMSDVERLAAEVADGGDAYPVGVRDCARRISTDMEIKGQGIAVLRGRA